MKINVFFMDLKNRKETAGRRFSGSSAKLSTSQPANIAAISVKNLSKAYRLGVIGRKTLQDELHYWWLKARGKDPTKVMGTVGKVSVEESRIGDEGQFWALRDISFEVNRGEVIGVIGRNGAGKSTLLKILTRITEPTSGDAILEGRVSSLLEVGTGFHPELTGRENIYLNGSILGMKKAEISRKYDEIVDFAEIGEFVDTPVKRYSSGMYIRLAFAVAAHLETEIMLVDEVLTVGDVAFQKKCLGKMKNVAGEGRTVLFVSHNMLAIKNLCSRALLIDQGRLVLDADADAVVARYLDRNLIEGSVASEAKIADRVEGVMKKSELPYFKITEIRLEDLHGVTKSVFNSSEPIIVCVSFTCLQTVRDLRVLVAVADENGIPIYGSQNMDDCESAENFYDIKPGGYMTKCTLPANIFGNRKYYLNAQMHYPKRESRVITKILEFRVDFDGYNPDIQYGSNDRDWFIWPKLSWSFRKLR
jgi:lipopolysaccharide transport system ATP-binding protein